VTVATTPPATPRRMQPPPPITGGQDTAGRPVRLPGAFLTGTDDQEVRFVDDGWVCRHADHVATLAVDPPRIVQGLPQWSAVLRVQAADGGEALRAALHRAGYREVVNASFDLDMRLAAAPAASGPPWRLPCAV
jgi:hypothetical protein